MARLYAPNGLLITGTAEKVYGTAWIANDDVQRDASGAFDIDYTGGTEIYWDTQETLTRENRERVFVDEDGDEWLESQLELRDAVEEDEDA